MAIGLRDGDAEVGRFVGALSGAGLLSSVSKVELEGGVYREAGLTEVRRRRLDLMLANLTVVVYDEADARTYGEIVRTCGYSRRKLLDRMIASQALRRRVRLVTRNPADFRDIPGLELIGL